jgi:hypothetical protein
MAAVPVDFAIVGNLTSNGLPRSIFYIAGQIL